MLMEIQAYVEPAKRNVVRQREDQKLKRKEDDSGDGGSKTPLVNLASQVIFCGGS